MSDLKCIKCESTETLMLQTIDGEEERICMECNSQQMEEDQPTDAVVTIEVVTSPPSPCFKAPFAIRTNEVVDLIKTNTESNNVTKTCETNEECDGVVVVVDGDDDDVVVDDATPSDNDLNNKNNNYNVGDVNVKGLESSPELKNEKHTNEAVVVQNEDKKGISIISKQDTRDPRILFPPPPPPPRKYVINMEALLSESVLNLQQKQENDGGYADVNKNQDHTITKETKSASNAAGAVENGASIMVARGAAAAAAATTTTATTTITASKRIMKAILPPPSMTMISAIKTTPSRTKTATTTTPASTIQEPKAKPVPPTKTSPTIIRRLRKSTRSTRFRSKMSASGNGSASGAGNAPGPSGSQNHHNYHHYASHNVGGGGGNHANSGASSSGKGHNKGGRNRRTLFKRPAVKTPIMHATTRFVTSVFFKGSYLQIGDIVSLVDGDNMVYYAQIRGLLVDAYCEKSAFLSWLIPTQDSPNPKEAFDPATYLIGPDEDFSRKLTYLKFVMHAPSNYFHDRTTPFPLPDVMDPVKQTGGYIWTHLPVEKSGQDTELGTDED